MRTALYDGEYLAVIKHPKNGSFSAGGWAAPRQGCAWVSGNRYRAVGGGDAGTRVQHALGQQAVRAVRGRFFARSGTGTAFAYPARAATRAAARQHAARQGSSRATAVSPTKATVLRQAERSWRPGSCQCLSAGRAGAVLRWGCWVPVPDLALRGRVSRRRAHGYGAAVYTNGDSCAACSSGEDSTVCVYRYASGWEKGGIGRTTTASAGSLRRKSASAWQRRPARQARATGLALGTDQHRNHFSSWALAIGDLAPVMALGKRSCHRCRRGRPALLRSQPARKLGYLHIVMNARLHSSNVII